MACTYSVPNKDISGDNLYGSRICNQPFIDWAWYSYNFDYDWWQDGWGYDDACNSSKPLARTFNAIWALDYSSPDPQNISYDNQNMLHWAGRFVREQISGYKLRATCGSNNTRIATTFGAGCTEYRKTVIWACDRYEQETAKACGSWPWYVRWICRAYNAVVHFFCVAWGWVASSVCAVGLEIGNAFSQIKRIELYNTNYFYGLEVMRRAATLVHECRHINGKAHDADFPSWATGLAGQSGADSNWDYGGAYRWEVCWLSWYWATAQNTTQPLKDKAKDTANSILGYAFAERPSFTF